VNVKTKSVDPSEKHLKFRKALEGALSNGGAELQADEILAITAHFLGQLIALQDQRKYDSEMVMALVTSNIQQGNSEAIAKLLNETGGSA
jgi:hypothetical protein